MDIFLIGIISYLMGSIPFGYILTKIFLKKDIREIGSGNIGATNALRAGNKSIGYFTLALDILKAIIPVVYVKIFYQDFLYIASLCAFLGHVFPIWLKFKGGKGVATGFGVILSLNLNIGIVALLIWVLIAKLFKISSMSALIAYFLIPVLMFYYETQIIYFLSSFLISLVCFVQHRENIKRLINRSEPKI